MPAGVNLTVEIFEEFHKNHFFLAFPVTEVTIIDVYDCRWTTATQLTFTCSKPTIETLGKGVKYVQS